MFKFNGGEIFPSLTAESVAHGTVTLPDAIPAGNWGVVFTYRANW